jgi:predicted 3-demethylubiquinone-9 3-methyltransferase (glyoxalase superfamily)
VVSAGALPAAALLFLGVGRFLDLSEVAEVPAVSRWQVYALVRTGALRAVRIGGRGVWRGEGCALEDYISSAYAATAGPIQPLPQFGRLGSGCGGAGGCAGSAPRDSASIWRATDEFDAPDRSVRDTITDEEVPMTTDGFTTCLWMDGQAEEAANHYTSIFEDSALGRVVRYTEAGPGPAGTVLTVEFELNGQRFVALNGGPQFTFNESISFQIHCDDQPEVDYYWSRLSEGGQEVACGWLKDRYGVSWQVIPTALLEMLDDPDPEKTNRATQAMLAMTKLDIAALRKAYAGE